MPRRYKIAEDGHPRVNVIRVTAAGEENSTPVLTKSQADRLGFGSFPPPPTFAVLDDSYTFGGILRYGLNKLMVVGGTTRRIARANMGKSAGKWYFEVVALYQGNNSAAGVVRADTDGTGYISSAANTQGRYALGADESIWGFLVNLDIGKLSTYHDGSLIDGPTTISGWSSGATYFPGMGPVDAIATLCVNFGETPFSYPGTPTAAGANMGWFG